MNVLEVKNISKSFKLNRKKESTLRDRIIDLTNLFSSDHDSLGKNVDFWALKNISFSLKQGDTLGIIGHNGAGKSTLLKIISKITPPSIGHIEIKGEIASLLEVGTGFHSELSGRENIFLNGAILGMTKKQINKNFNAIVDFSGIEKFIDTPVKHYSSGMYVRLAFAVAAFMESDILLIDEVLAVGDREFQTKCLQKIKSIEENGRQTIIFVSHNLESVKRVCNKCLLLKNGELDFWGDTENAINYYLNDKNKDVSYNLSSRIDRKGDGRGKVLNVYLRNEKGQDVDSFYSGKDAYIWVEYEIYDNRIKELDFSFPLSNFGGVNKLAHIYTKTVGQTISIKDRKGFIVLHIGRLPLNEGEYFYNVWLESNGLLLDWVINAGNIKVKRGDFYNTGSLPLADQGSYLLDYNFKCL